MRFGDYLERNLFQPLGMEDTAFFVPPEKAHRLCATFWKRPGLPDDLWIRPHLCCAITTERPAFESGGAGLYSTIGDYERFARMLLNMGELDGARVLQPKTVAWMTKHQLNVEQARLTDTWPYMGGFGYGKLMRVCLQPGANAGLCCEGEYGWDGWLGTYFANLPKERVTILYMTSRLNDTPEDSGLIRRIRNTVIASL